MSTLDFTTLDVFTSTPYAGNPLAVVKLPASLAPSPTQDQKQAIAREFNLSETLFLHERQAAQPDVPPEWRVDIFLTDMEIPFAGHPVIGAACHVLGELAAAQDKAQTGSEVVRGKFQVKAGTIGLEYNVKNGEANASIPHNVRIHSNRPTSEAVFATQPALQTHLQSSGRTMLQADLVSPVKGMSFLMVKLPSLEALETIKPYSGQLGMELDEGWGFGPFFSLYYVELPSTDGSDEVNLRTRMVNDAFEDPATGSASCGLGAYLSLQRGDKAHTRKYNIVQGVEMGRRSEIGVEVTTTKEGRIDEIHLSGQAVQVMEGRLRY
ncbi:hypothetical protein H2203_004328 [Taxawa tesnikishii (nom. ined.)]|nr:hypothetical protein H2203_004328 [Dothideales sp. JES 119]